MPESPFKYKQAIILRADLEMSVGKLISQACHACLEAVDEAKRTRHEAWKRWRDEGAKKVILKLESLEELLELARRAEELGIPNALVENMGLTEVPKGTVTALGVGPEKSELIDNVTGNLRLL